MGLFAVTGSDATAQYVNTTEVMSLYCSDGTTSLLSKMIGAVAC